MSPLELYLVSFNCAREYVNPRAFAPHFFDAWPRNKTLPDIIAISLQEVAPIAYAFLGASHIDAYLQEIVRTVDMAAEKQDSGGSATRSKYQVVEQYSVGMIAVLVLARDELLGNIEDVEKAGVGVGFYDMGNKGAAAVRLRVRDSGSSQPTSLTFVAAHLYPHETGVKKRNEDWKNIVRNLVFEQKASSTTRGDPNAEDAPLLSKNGASKDSQMFDASSHLFFLGDLNYRTNDSKAHEDAHLAYPCATAEVAEPRHYTKLLAQDQLSREKDAGRTLHGLTEQPIGFPPTYKYDQPDKEELGKSVADGEEWRFAKHRFPSWCDRILFTQDKGLQPHVYTALPLQPTSDHRPVALSVTVEGPRSAPEDPTMGNLSAPFPVNKNWRSHRKTARQREVIVGAASWIALTRNGNIAAAFMVGIGLLTWWLTATQL